MKTTQWQVLMIMSSDEKNVSKMREILIHRGYGVYQAVRLSTGIEKITENSPDLVICQHGIEGESGFRIFNRLHPILSQRGIPFMLYMKEFRKEDILIGLEMGIDNFIIDPCDESTLLNKVEKQIVKSKKGKITDSEQFKHLFETTPVAKFIVENNNLTLVNEAFLRLTGVKRESTSFSKINEVFDFSENETNELNFQKCMNGLRQCCLFKSVPLVENHALRFDIHMVSNDSFEKNVFTSEVTLAQTELYRQIDERTKDLNNKNSDTATAKGKQKVILTRREQEILELSSKGLSIKQIANDLGISDRTVEKHRANIMEKTQTGNIVEAIYFFH